MLGLHPTSPTQIPTPGPHDALSSQIYLFIFLESTAPNMKHLQPPSLSLSLSLSLSSRQPSISPELQSLAVHILSSRRWPSISLELQSAVSLSVSSYTKNHNWYKNLLVSGTYNNYKPYQTPHSLDIYITPFMISPFHQEDV